MSTATTLLMQNTFGQPEDVWKGETAVSNPVKSEQIPMKTRRLSVDLDPDLHILVKIESAKTGICVADIVRQLLEKRFLAK